MIKKTIDECITHFKNNPFFRKLVITFSATGCIIFFLFGVLTIFALSKASFTQMNATEKKMLDQSCNTANQILRDIHSLSNNKFEEDSAIRSAMTSPYDVRISMALQASFEDIMASSTLIDSIYVANLKHNIIYSTVTSAQKATEFCDADIIAYLSQNEPKSDIFFSRSAELIPNSFNHESKHYITSVYRNSEDCALVINLDQEEFQSLINLKSDSQHYETVILDSDGFVISHTNPEVFAKNMTDDPLFKQVLNSKQDSGSFKYSGATVNFVRSDTLGYSYISISTAGNPLGSFKSMLTYMVLFTILLLIVYVICSVLLSLSAYSVFNNLKKNIYNLFNKNDSEDTKDEIETISKLLDEAKTKYRNMETIQYKYANSKQNTTLKKLLTGTFSYLQDDMQSCDITFPYQGFAVIIVRPDGLQKMDSDTLYTIKYAIMNMGKEIFEANSIAYVSEINEYDVAFILNFIQVDFIEDSLGTLNYYMKKFFDSTASAAYDCAILESLEDISVLYHNSKCALPYKLTRGYSSIIKYDDIVKLDSSVSAYPENMETDIIKSITSQNENAIAKNVHTFTEELKNISYNAIVLYTDRLLHAIDQLAVRSNMSDDTDISLNIMTIISDLETLEKIEKYILSKCQSLMLKFSNTKLDSKKDIMVKNILDYIEDNYTDPNLSIDMIASEINRSANYTRSIFKQGQGVSISDYIAKKRFDEVCRQLIETNLTAQEIGTNLGLNSGSYFYTSFKKHTGYTPDQYRKLHKQANN